MVLLNKYKKIQEKLNIIGESEKMREVVELVMSVAPTNVTVLIQGESGVGKEVIAKAIHQLSAQKDKPMISVNLGAIPEGLMESELFGHEKGAFTGAIAMKKGYFELADKGTIFLDEIGETPLQTQVKLLRVLESGEFMRVGSAELKKVSVRVITATNRNLGDMVRKNQFRKDLYYRLKAVTINIPPLRERREDIPLLLDHFIKKLAEDVNIQFAGFTPEAMRILEQYNWPGNVRELKNFVESIAVLASGKMVDASMVREHLGHYEEITETMPTLPIPAHRSVDQTERELIYKALLSLGVEMREMKEHLINISNHLNNRQISPDIENAYYEEEHIPTLQEMEKEMINRALIKYRGNKRKTAQILGISERTLYRKLKEYDLQ
ncbi:MAG: sigma-54 dependent transcriptional regulator [Calditrichia bacterium]